MTRDAVVFFAHNWNRRLALHYDRLKREVSPLHEVVLAYNLPTNDATPPAGAPIDILIRPADIERNFPLRYAQMLAKSKNLIWGYVDIAWMTAYLSPRLADYDRFWLVEYDVDFSGDWAKFFSVAMEGDLLATNVRRRSDEPNFFHLTRYRQPADGPADPLIMLFSLSRLSRALVLDLQQTLGRPGWEGHFELVLPNIALMHGFSYAGISDNSLFTPPERRNRFYTAGDNSSGQPLPTFGFRPPRAYRYFVIAPRDFHTPDLLYHPVKGGNPLFRYLYPVRKYLRRTLRPILGRWRQFTRGLR